MNEESPESYTLYPIWICECDYTQSAKEDGSVYIADAGLREGTKFTRIGFNAQTGKLLDKQNFSWNDMYGIQFMRTANFYHIWVKNRRKEEKWKF